jgi:chemotaxis protein MotB
VPTSIDSVRQFTVDSARNTLDHMEKKHDERSDEERARDAQLEADLERLREVLKDEIEKGLATVSRQGGRIIVQIHEHGSFPSGSADLHDSVLPTIDKLSTQITIMDGVVQVTGHTDDVPIRTTRFRSNWDLSAARAVSVAHRLMNEDGVAPERIVVTGLADTLPLNPNDSPENRARNRRVQVTIVRSADVAPVEEPAQESPEPTVESDNEARIAS